MRQGIGFGLAYGFFLAAASLAVHVGSGLDSTELTFYQTPSLSQAPVIAGVCIFGVTSQFFQTKAYTFLPAAIASAFGLTSVVWGFFFDIVLFGKQVSAVQIASYVSFIAAIAVLVYLRNASKEA